MVVYVGGSSELCTATGIAPNLPQTFVSSLVTQVAQFDFGRPLPPLKRKEKRKTRKT